MNSGGFHFTWLQVEKPSIYTAGVSFGKGMRHGKRKGANDKLSFLKSVSWIWWGSLGDWSPSYFHFLRIFFKGTLIYWCTRQLNCFRVGNWASLFISRFWGWNNLKYSQQIRVIKLGSKPKHLCHLNTDSDSQC